MIKTPTTRRRKAETPPEEIPESIFDALNLNPPGQGPNEARPLDAATAAPKPDAGPSMTDLLRQIGEMNARLEQAERANMALTSSPPIAPPVKEPQFNLENLPDPVSDPQAYAREVATRNMTYQADLRRYHEGQQAATASQEGNASALWEDFSDAYGSYAEDQEGVEFAVQRVVQAAKRRGVDINRYMYGNTDRFFRDVTKAYDARFGKPDEEGQEPEPTPAPRQRKVQRQQADDGDDGRTAGIFGGQEGGSQGRAPARPPPGDMIKDLQDMQRRSGYY